MTDPINLNKNIYGWFKGLKVDIEALTGIPVPSIGFGWTTDESDGEFGVYNGVAWAWGAGGGGMPVPFALPNDISDTITADVDDYEPTGLATADVIRISASGGDWSLTGLAGGADGRVVIIENVSSPARSIILSYEDTASIAANRFRTNGDIVILPNKSVLLMYDNTVSRWMLVASGQADSLQGVPIAGGLSSLISSNDLLIYNAGDNVMEPVAPAAVVEIGLSTVGTSLTELQDLTDGGESTLHTHPATAGEAFPVGSVFISVVSTNPATLLGYGTWSSFGAGRVLVGLDAGQTEFDTVEETGGSKTHTLTTGEMPSHTHTQNAHTHTQDSHNHTQNAHAHSPFSAGTYGFPAPGGGAGSSLMTGGTALGLSTGSQTATNIAATATNQNTTAVNQNTGGGGAHNNLQPYIVVYMWKRTA